MKNKNNSGLTEPTREATLPRTEMELEDLYKSDPLNACRKALRLTQHLDADKRLDKIDTLLGNYGVEAIRGEWQNGYWGDVVATFSNAGDTYTLTVLRIRDDYGSGSHFIVSSMGDFVERNTKRYGIQ